MTTRTTRIPVRWMIIGLIAIATIINYIDRNALAVMWPEISKELGYGKDEYAVLVTSFMVAYAVGQLAFGRIFDKVGTRTGFVLAIAVWSIAIAAHAFARSMGSFIALRMLLGVSEAGAWPGTAKANAEWFPVKERALAQGIFNAGASIGAIVSAPLIATLFLLLGWPSVFLLIGIGGMLWIIPWLIVCRAPPEAHPWLSAAEREEILTGRVPANTDPDAVTYTPGLKELLRHKEAWGIVLARFLIDPIWWLFVSWLPIYLADSFGFDIKQIGLFGWVPFVGAAIGSLLGGWVAGRLISAGWEVGRARKAVIVAGGVVMVPALLATAVAATPLVAVLLIAVILFGFQLAISNIQTLPGDYLAGSAVGTLAGFSGMAAVLGVLVVTWTVPVLAEISYAPVFILSAAFVPLSILSILFLCRRVERLTPLP